MSLILTSLSLTFVTEWPELWLQVGAAETKEAAAMMRRDLTANMVGLSCGVELSFEVEVEVSRLKRVVV